jgi:hypothetical protein
MEFISEIKEFFQEHRQIWWWFVAFSVVTFVGSLVLVPWLLARLPADYFSHRRRHRTEWADEHPLIRFLLKLGKNLGGLALFISGMFMFFPPGMGLVTMFAGLVLMDFPGKYRLERWAINRKPVIRSVNWLRARYDKPPMEMWHLKRENPPPESEAGDVRES